MTEHTKTPWAVDMKCGTRILAPAERHKVTPQHPEYVVAQCGIYVTPKGLLQHINAEHIVHCVNLHDELVAAVRRRVVECNCHDGAIKHYSCDRCNQDRALLKRCEEEKYHEGVHKICRPSWCDG